MHARLRAAHMKVYFFLCVKETTCSTILGSLDLQGLQSGSRFLLEAKASGGSSIGVPGVRPPPLLGEIIAFSCIFLE